MTRSAAAVGFHAEETAPNTMRLVGKIRPNWCLKLARPLAIPTLGASLLLLRIRKTCVGTASVTDGLAGLQVRLSGQLPEYLPSVVEQLLAERHFLDGPEQDLGTDSFGPPATAGPSLSTSPVPSKRRFSSRPIGPVPHSTADEGADINDTIARRRRIDLTPGAPLLTFDTGVAMTVRGLALIGRAPTADANDPSALLLPIDDPGLSVSSTHLAIGVDAQGFWVCDRHSTNGSAVTDVDGVKVRCIAGQRHYVASGSTVQMGDRSFSVVLSGMSISQSR